MGLWKNEWAVDRRYENNQLAVELQIERDDGGGSLEGRLFNISKMFGIKGRKSPKKMTTSDKGVSGGA